MRLEAAGIPDASLEAEVLLMHVTGRTRADLFASLDERLGGSVVWRLDEETRWRRSRRPLAYITRHREFFGLDLFVDERVLIPRQETETLVEETLAIARREFPDGRCAIADVGTGSGCIAVSLAVNLPGARVYAADAYQTPLNVAKENARRHDVMGRMLFLRGDLLEPVRDPVDIVVANLPYVPEGEWPTLAPEVRHEPRSAILAGPDGLELMERLVRQAVDRVAPPRWLVLEMGDAIASKTPQHIGGLVRQRFPHASMRTVKDLGGLERVLAIDLSACDASPSVVAASALRR